MKTEIQNIAATLKHTFLKNAWHGPSVKETLEGLTQEQANLRLPNTHSIIELVTHMTSWRTFVISRLTGDNDFIVSDELNFPKEKNWEKATQDLDESQGKLIAAIENFPESRLYDIVAHSEYKYTFYILLHGIIHHDLYHTGQIALIRKSFEKGPS